MSLYEMQYAQVTGTVIRSEEYWRWMIGRRYAHVIWVACQGETVRGYAFVKDHKILEIASDPAHPQALRSLLGRVRAEALERAYPQVTVHAPVNHPVIEAFLSASGRLVDQDIVDGAVDVPHSRRGRVPQVHSSGAEPRAVAAGSALPLELGITTDDHRWLIHIEGKNSRVEPDKLSRRHLTLTPQTLVRLLMGHTSVDAAASEEGFVASTATALDAARILFPVQPIWRSPLDAATA